MKPVENDRFAANVRLDVITFLSLFSIDCRRFLRCRLLLVRCHPSRIAANEAALAGIPFPVRAGHVSFVAGCGQHLCRNQHAMLLPSARLGEGRFSCRARS